MANKRDTKKDPKVIFITGCSRGFGYLTAKTLAKKGYKVYASMRNVDSRNKVKKEELVTFASDEGTFLKVIECDVLSLDSVNNAIQSVIDAEKKIDVLVNNAGYALYGPIELGKEEDYLKMFDTNFYGYIRTIRVVLPHMRSRRSGQIINVSSTMGEIGLPYCGYYNAAKFAIVAMSEALLGECYLFNINVSIIEPIGYGTDFLGSSMKLTSDPEEDTDYKRTYGSFMKNCHKFGENTNPQDVADKIAWMVKKGKPPFRVPVGTFSRTGEVLSKWLHPRAMQKITATIYGFKEWLK
ncbi:MAG: SDR family oxidoreductase [Candidatus Hodarchaeota archaeon]